MYDVLYKVASSKNLDVLYSNFFEQKESGEINQRIEVDTNGFYETSDDIFTFMLDMIGTEPSFYIDRRYEMSVCVALYKNKVIYENNITFPSEKEMISEDIIFQILFLSKSNKIGYIATCFYYYCENPNSLTHSYRFDRFERFKILHYEIVRLLSSLYPKELFKINLSANRLLLGYIRAGVFYFEREDLERIVIDSYVSEIIKEYPYMKTNIKDKIFILSLKSQQVSLLEFLFKLNKLKKKWKISSLYKSYKEFKLKPNKERSYLK
jgi:hypothetical protein